MCGNDDARVYLSSITERDKVQVSHGSITTVVVVVVVVVVWVAVGKRLSLQVGKVSPSIQTVLIVNCSLPQGYISEVHALLVQGHSLPPQEVSLAKTLRPSSL